MMKILSMKTATKYGRIPNKFVYSTILSVSFACQNSFYRARVVASAISIIGHGL